MTVAEGQREYLPPHAAAFNGSEEGVGGQVLALYLGEECLGGAEILSVGPSYHAQVPRS